MSKRGNRMQVQQEDLNLIPIMGLMIILIPMVLFAYNFFEVKVQAVAAPRLGGAGVKAADADQKVPLNLTVHIDKDGFKLKANEVFSDLVLPEIPKAKFQVSTDQGQGALQVTEYDYPRLYTLLRSLKEQERFKAEDSLNISAEMDIPWHVIAATIDAARVKLTTPDFTTAGNYEGALELYRRDPPVMVDGAAKDSAGNPIKEPALMFPRVVFTVAETVN